MSLSDRELQRQKLREGQSGATRISLKVASPLESLISACADAENRTLKDFVDQLADLANLEDLLSAGQKNNVAVDSGASRTKMWRQAVKWAKNSPGGARRTRYISNEMKDSLELLENYFGCHRDEAYMAICLMGLEAYLFLLSEDVIQVDEAVRAFDDLYVSYEFQECISWENKLDFGDPAPRQMELENLVNAKREQLKEIATTKRQTFRHAHSLAEQFPDFILTALQEPKKPWTFNCEIFFGKRP